MRGSSYCAAPTTTNFGPMNEQTSPAPRPLATKMRGTTRSRPVSQHGTPPVYAQPMTQAPRKIFNCIVDDTALVAGVKRSTRNGIRQWVKNGQIRLFVPLHALEQLSQQKSAVSRHGEDVRETLQWLDDATSKFPNFVTLQGGDQYYERWVEVERFTVPRTLFSENDHYAALEDDAATESLPQRTAKVTISHEPPRSPASSAASVGSGAASPSSLQSVRSSISQVSPPTSPAKALSSPSQPPHIDYATASGSASTSVPMKLQPLFNYILWRIHQELDPIAALESFIFLCNDADKVHYAKGFDIKCKRLEQLREAIGREERDFRNRISMQNRENQQALTAPSSGTLNEKSVDDEEVTYEPPPRAPAAMLPKPVTTVIDPNAFSRASHPEQGVVQSAPPRFDSDVPLAQQSRGGANLPFNNRGAMRGNYRGSRGRANFVPGRGGLIANAPRTPNGQIDPDSFTRPRGGYSTQGRKLWVPTQSRP
ncbi:hypothetical protein BAUCODRAFT_132513 [Baudoinia panamericana UAMH 10762]|uniref:PIN domain-containing protein n=1 Tax=Baudoinia panamericana (strain UAMH 10762) TaxID=717646 RepID=M2N6I8_BAUPA|nr:uncharacterized protein BAUCODRAFT_132513 [Baudoinia panamericana UAMH 10762]EMC94669.1 hypothetical protein BAUCODRAFT_132513 [Baudoinia panamericana UAMH 10762]